MRSRSFGFVVFEGPNELIDFGVRNFRTGANAVQVSPRKKLATLLDEFKPAAVIQNDTLFRRTKRHLKIGEALLQELQKRRIPPKHVTRREVEKAFQGHSSNKHAIATVLAQRFPALESKLPSKRKCWQSENYRMSVFDAAALAVGYFSRSLP